MGITKTDFMRGMQCMKMLWLDKHKPKLKIIPPEVQKQRDEINVIPGEQCTNPYECWYYEYCHRGKQEN